MNPIGISKELWEVTWLGLRARGRGQREAACVWGGKRSISVNQVHSVTFLDDLPGVVAGPLYHRPSRATVRALFDVLRERNEMIVGDIHTHPGDWVGLSDIDAAHPIEFRRGLPALIIPRYAISEPALEGLGLHEYVGDGEWRTLDSDEINRTLLIGS